MLVLQAALVGAAAVAALAPWPPDAVERLYANGAYPALQAFATASANQVAFAWFDVAVAGLLVALVAIVIRAARDARRQRSGAPVASALRRLAVLAAGSYLWFLLAWGLNYARPPVETRLGLAARPVTGAEVEALLRRAIDDANREAAPAYAQGFADLWTVAAPLAAALHEVERLDGRPRPSVPGVPKRTLLAPFFRAAAVDGMIAPFLLEALVNPDLTPPERPFVLAHEWAHLSGYAPEADASFAGWRAASRADAPSRYSAALFLVGEAASQVPHDARRTALARLGEAPRRDLEATAARIRAGRVQAVHQASWTAYDQYLKAQGVEEGVRSYSRVVELVIRDRGR